MGEEGSIGKGIVLATTTSNGAGAYSFTAAQVGTLTQGNHSFRAVATDAAGNTAQDSATITLDTTAPSITLDTPTDGLSTSATSFPVSGTTEPNTQVDLVIDGNVLATVTSNGAGAFSFTAAQVGTLSEGPHLVVVVATDAAGNNATDSANVIVDTVDPLLTLVDPADGLITNANTQGAAGVTDALGDVELFVDGTSVGTTTANAAGLYSFTAAQVGTLPDGTHTFTAVATDAAGNTTSVTNTIVVDTAAPTITITGPADGSTTPLDTDVTGTTEAGATVVVTIDKGTADEQQFTVVADSNGTFTVPITVGGGSHTIEATATDAAGNTSTDTSAFDAYAISLTLDTPTGRTSSDRPAVSGTTDPNTLVTIVIDEGLATEIKHRVEAPRAGNFRHIGWIAVEQLADQHEVRATLLGGLLVERVPKVV